APAPQPITAAPPPPPVSPAPALTATPPAPAPVPASKPTPAPTATSKPAPSAAAARMAELQERYRALNVRYARDAAQLAQSRAQARAVNRGDKDMLARVTTLLRTIPAAIALGDTAKAEQQIAAAEAALGQLEA